MIVRLTQFAGRRSDPYFTGRLSSEHVALSCRFMHQLYAKPTLDQHDTARRQKGIFVKRAWLFENSRWYYDASCACLDVGDLALAIELRQTAARLMQTGRHAPSITFVEAAIKRMSRIRAKQSEIFLREALPDLDVQIDLDIHAHGDGGIDALVGGYWVQIKRFGTQKTTRGFVRFVLDSNDKYYIEDPPWDLGFVCEDDPFDPRAWRLSGWITYSMGRYGKRWMPDCVPAAPGVEPPMPPDRLFTWDWHQTTDKWDSNSTHPFLGFPRNPPRPWPSAKPMENSCDER